MGIFTRDQFAKPDDDAGVFIDGLGRALVTWVAMQEHAVMLHDAAKVFNTTPEIIAEAIEDTMWISVDGDTLVLDGE